MTHRACLLFTGFAGRAVAMAPLPLRAPQRTGDDTPSIGTPRPRTCERPIVWRPRPS